MADDLFTNFMTEGSHDWQDPLIDGRVQLLVNRTVFLYSRFRDVISSTLQEYGNENPELASVVAGLFRFASGRHQAVVFLLQAAYIWDAEILMRSFTEALCKMLFICFAEDEERSERIKEFKHDLGDIRQIQRSDRIKKLASTYRSDKKDKHAFWLSFQILSEEEEHELRTRYPRAQRKLLDHKWAFFEMVEEIDRFLQSKASGHREPMSPALFLAFSNASSLIHAQELALLVTEDHDRRDERIRIKKSNYHTCTLLENTIAMLLLLCNAIEFAFKAKSLLSASMIADCNEFFADSKKFGVEFFNAQDELDSKSDC